MGSITGTGLALGCDTVEGVTWFGNSTNVGAKVRQVVHIAVLSWPSVAS